MSLLNLYNSLLVQIGADALQDETTILGDLYEPPAVEFSFEPIGWTVLAYTLILLVGLVGFLALRKYIKNRYRREAIKELNQISNSAQIQTVEVFVVLKRVAIQVFGRESVGELNGIAWLEFLERTAKGVNMKTFEEKLILSVYKGEVIPESANKMLLENAKKWIRNHAN